MPVFGSRATKAAVVKRKASGPSAPAEPPIRIVHPEPLQVGTATVTVRTRGVPYVGVAVFANTPPGYPWYDAETRDNIAVNAQGEATLTVTLRAVGDKIKAFRSTGPAARDFTDQAESVGAVAAPGSTPPPVAGTGNAAALLAKMGLGVNQERFTVLPENHPQAQSAAYYQRYRDLGVKVVRFFIPCSFYEWTLQPGSANASDMAPWLNAVQACVDSGMPVTHLDACDVVEDGMVADQPGRFGELDGYIQRFGAAVAARNFPADRVMVGAINEYGGTRGNAFWEPHRLRWNGYLRAALPNHTIVEGPSCWKHVQALFDPNFVPWDGQPAQGAFNKWSDPNSIVDVHHYLGWDADGMDWLFTQAKAWSQANGRGVYCGEFGFDDQAYGDYWNIQRWIDRMDSLTQYESVCLIRPTLWANTNGSAWPITENGGNTPRPGMGDGMKRWAGRIDTRVAGATPTTPAQPTTPPPQGDGGTLNILVRGQSNAYLFCEWGNGYPEGVRLMRERIQQLTGRKVNTIFGFQNSGDNTIYSGTEFLTQWMSGTSAGEYENAFLRFIGSRPAAEKTAPFVELWLHNESDQKNNPPTSQWVAAVRAEAALARSAVGLSASQYLRYFVPIRYNYGDITSIRNGMDQLAADSSFNARVSMAAWSLRMDGDAGSAGNSSHMGKQDAADLAENLAQELAALYPSGGTVQTPTPSTGTTPPPPPPSTGRSITITPKDPPRNSTGTYSGTLTVTGIARVTVAVQNDQNGTPPWGFASTREYAVPANGQVAINATFTAGGQFLQVFDSADPAFQAYGDSFYFA